MEKEKEFTYKAIDPNGHEVEGSILGKDSSEVNAKLKEQGLFPVSITDVEASKVKPNKYTKEKYKNRLNPQLFGLWIGMASITMMFAALTSAYIVRQAAGNWLEFRLPDLFF